LLVNGNAEAFHKGFGGQTVSVEFLGFTEISRYCRIDNIVKISKPGDNKSGRRHHARSGDTRNIPVPDMIELGMGKLVGDNESNCDIVIFKETFGKMNLVFTVNPGGKLLRLYKSDIRGDAVVGQFKASAGLLINGYGRAVSDGLRRGMGDELPLRSAPA
jgi:hypothetical protein